MMGFSPAVKEKLRARQLVFRDFLWFVVRDRLDNSPVTDGYWSGVGTKTATVINPDTGNAEQRTWFGAGALIQINDIPRVSNISVQNAVIVLSQVATRTNQLVRTYDCRRGKVQIFRGIYDPLTGQLVAPALARFAGFIDRIEIKTPEEGSEGGVTITCASHTQEMTRSNPDTRADASQKLRDPTDNFFQDAGVVGEWTQYWGNEKGAAASANTSPAGTAGLSGFNGAAGQG